MRSPQWSHSSAASGLGHSLASTAEIRENVKLGADCVCSGSDKCLVPLVAGRARYHRCLRSARANRLNHFVALPAVQIIVEEDRVEP